MTPSKTMMRRPDHCRIETIFDRAGLALVGVADDVFLGDPLGRAGVLDVLPFLVGRHAGAAHPAQFGDLQGLDQPRAVGVVQEVAGGLIRLEPGVAIGVDLPAGGLVRLLMLRGRGRARFRGLPDECLVLRGRPAPIDAVPHDDGRRGVALAEAGCVPHRDRPAEPDGQPPEPVAALGGAPEVARHVAADLHLQPRRPLQPVVREEAGDLVEPPERQPLPHRLGPRRQGFQLVGRQVAAPVLDAVQLVLDVDLPGVHRGRRPRRGSGRGSVVA